MEKPVKPIKPALKHTRPLSKISPNFNNYRQEPSSLQPYQMVITGRSTSRNTSKSFRTLAKATELAAFAQAETNGVTTEEATAAVHAASTTSIVPVTSAPSVSLFSEVKENTSSLSDEERQPLEPATLEEEDYSDG